MIKGLFFLIVIFSLVRFVGCSDSNESAKTKDEKQINSTQELNQWGESKTKICKEYAVTRQECATAADFTQCMDIKDKHRSPYNPSIAMWSQDQYSCEVDGSIKKY
jgi:hypothetical protein